MKPSGASLDFGDVWVAEGLAELDVEAWQSAVRCQDARHLAQRLPGDHTEVSERYYSPETDALQAQGWKTTAVSSRRRSTLLPERLEAKSKNCWVVLGNARAFQLG